MLVPVLLSSSPQQHVDQVGSVAGVHARLWRARRGDTGMPGCGEGESEGEGLESSAVDGLDATARALLEHCVERAEPPRLSSV